VIYLDTTSASSWRHSSGLARVSRRLQGELGTAAQGAAWPFIATRPSKEDWIFTPELFSERERPGFTAFLNARPCRLAALFHDAIPLRFPSITWPQSVERHPGYMKLLARFDRVWAVSAASRDELLGFWKWQGVSAHPAVEVLSLGADWKGVERLNGPLAEDPGPLKIVCIGILEPRKNQGVLIDAFETLRSEGLKFELHLVGRVNPHFGGPIKRRVDAVAERLPGLFHHEKMDDAALVRLLWSARATAFPSLAEGCGLPVLESLWMALPCVCSDIPPVIENANGGGCVVVKGNQLEGWVSALRRLLSDEDYHGKLAAEASARSLPTWAGAARVLREALTASPS
jgi:glycosyltransferase involved in cell wall biosynthesis